MYVINQNCCINKSKYFLGICQLRWLSGFHIPPRWKHAGHEFKSPAT
jgi:hypothetical protein